MLTPNLRQIAYVLAIARDGGLTAAAHRLNVSQPALSVALARIETQLGQPLFYRRKGAPMVPTGFGLAWLAQAEARLQALGDLFHQPPQPALRLALFQDLAPLVLAPLIARAAALGLTPNPASFGFAALIAALQTGQADAGITWDLGLPPDLDRVGLVALAPQAVLAPDHPLGRARALNLADLAGQPLVLADQDLSIAHWHAKFAQKGLDLRLAHRCASPDLMRSFAAHGLGIGLGYVHPAAPQAQDGRPLRLVPLTDAGTERLVLARPASPGPQAGAPDLPQVLARLLRAALPGAAKAL